MGDDVFGKNIEAIAPRFPYLLSTLSKERPDLSPYTTRLTKTGLSVPVDSAGTVLHSLYDPEREARQIVDQIPGDSFVLFAGIGGGYHVREFLRRRPNARCAICESGVVEFRSLLRQFDFSDILSNPHLLFVSYCDDPAISDRLSEGYLPAIHGNFSLLPLRPWLNRHGSEYAALELSIKHALERISADYSVQAHFGRIWLRNFAQNLAMLSTAQGTLPKFDVSKEAVIAAAGPGLEACLDELHAHRDEYVIFATDTAFSTLCDSGIQPDAFVSIDAQSISVRHAMHRFVPSMTVIMDLCGNPGIVRIARKYGCNLIFAAGGHPLARYAATFSPLPGLDSSSGTVTVAAFDAARSCGFSKIRVCGADFAYTGGKPYARGTYLSATFDGTSSRLNPAETQYDILMFRTAVRQELAGDGITYRTDVLDRYSAALAAYRPGKVWTPSLFASFPVDEFISRYRADIARILASGNLDDSLLVTLYPFMAWHAAKKGPGMREAIQLASDLIAGYTKVS